MVTPAPDAADASVEGASGAPTASDRAHRVADAVAGWQRALADVGGRNSLLWYQDLPLGSLDLTTAHPGGVSKLLAGRPTTIADLVREPAALVEARARARAISLACETVLEQRGLPIGFLALGMATWSTPGPRHPQAPVMLRPVTLRPTGPSALDFELDLGLEVEVNPVLAHYLRLEAHVVVDEAALAARAEGGHGFDPYPVYVELSRICADVPEFSVTPRLIISTFPHSKLDMVADLAAQQDVLPDHDVVAALAGDAEARAHLRRITPNPPVDPDRDPASERLVLDADSGQGDVVDAVRRGANLAVEAPPGTGVTQTVANLVAALVADGRSVLLVSPDRRDLTQTVDRLGQVGLADLVLDATWAGVSRRATLQQVVDTFEAVVERDRPPGAAGMPGTAARGGPALAGTGAAGGRARLTDYRDRLRDHVAALHEVRDPWGVSVHEAQWAIAELGARRPSPASQVRLRGDALIALPRTRLGELAHDLTAAAEAGAWSTDDAPDPWYAAHVVTEEDAEHAHEVVTRLSGGGLDAAASTLDGILGESSLPSARTALDWERALLTMAGVRETLEVFRPEIFDNPLDEHVAATASGDARRQGGVELGAWARSRVRGQAKRLLRPGRPPADLHAELVAARRHRQAWHELVGAGGRPEISPRLDEAERAFGAFRADLDWLASRLPPTAAPTPAAASTPTRTLTSSATSTRTPASTPAGGGGELLSLPLKDLAARLDGLAGRLDRLAVLPAVTPLIDDLRAGGLADVVDDFAHRRVSSAEVSPELELIWWVSLVQHVTQSDPRYGHHDGAQLRRAALDYDTADRAQLTRTATIIRDTVARRVRAAVAAHRDAAAALLAGVDGPGRPRRIRDLLAESPDLLLAARPCWAMSPLAVAAVVPVGRVFDVVVIDGAGRLSPAEAVSAISRGRQVVAFGDPGGPPPAPFSTAVVPVASRNGPTGSTRSAGSGGSGTPDTSGTPEIPVTPVLPVIPDTSGTRDTSVPDPGPARSVFDLLAEVLPVRRLSWHYAPRDERLLAQADSAAYGSRWVTFPGIEVASPVRVERVEGSALVAAGSETAIETTEAEVRRVVELVLEHASTRPAESLGVIAVTRAHAARIREVLDDVLRQAADEVAAFFDPRAAEPFSVRSIDVVRSARWDAVILAVGYGTTPHGRVLHRFPDLELPGADRWLRSATTRSRQRLTVVTSLGADHLDPQRLRTPGPSALRALLLGVDGPTAGEDAGRRARDPLMADLADRLRREGLDVSEDVGTSRHTLDLVVHDPRVPGRRLVAVEGDGAGYAAMRGTRERDRLWAQHLESLGWRYVRIWSTDLYRDPASEVARVVAATRASSSDPSDPSESDGSEDNGGHGREEHVTGAPRADATADPAPDEGRSSGDGGRGKGEAADAPTTRRRRRAFRRSTAGEAAPETERTVDDTDAGWGDGSPEDTEGTHDRWLAEQRPPHWGRD